MQHQKDWLEFARGKNAAGLLFEQGLGKTLAMLEFIKVHGSPYNFPMLIVSPLSVVSVWEKEIEKFGYGHRVSKITGPRIDRLKAIKEPADVYLINYEGLRLYKDELLAKGFKTIVLDESHRAKERSSQQTEVAVMLGRRIPNRYILTGTLVPNSPLDVWSQVDFLQPDYLGNFFSFRNRYVNFKTMKIWVRNKKSGQLEHKEIQKAFSFKNLPELEKKIKEICFRRTKAECLDLPDKIYKMVYCEMTPEQASAYKSFKRTLTAMIDSHQLNRSNAKSAVQTLRQICQGFVYDGEENKKPVFFKSSGKIKALKDLLTDIQDNVHMDCKDPTKAIVFTYYRADIEYLQEQLKDCGYKVFVYDGDADDRGAIVDTFQNIDEDAIFLANIDKAKEGITLTAANHVIYYGNSYSYGTRAQSEDRAHRVGQKKNVIYYDLVCQGTYEEKIIQILKHKKDVADIINGDDIRLAMLFAERDE